MSVRSTSKKSLREVIESGVLGDMQKMVYEALHSYGPCTANELYKHLTRRKKINQANITTRLGELRAMGSAAEKGKRVCSVTGKRVLVWECTHKIPIKYIKPKSKATQITELKTLLREASYYVNICLEQCWDEDDYEYIEDLQYNIKEALKDI